MTDILDLGGLAPERPLARIRTEANPEGDLYELLVPENLGAADLARLSRLFTDHDLLWEKARRTKAEDARLEGLLNRMAGTLVPDAPAEAVEALPALTKRGLAVRFFVEAGVMAQRPLAGLSLPENN